MRARAHTRALTCARERTRARAHTGRTRKRTHAQRTQKRRAKACEARAATRTCVHTAIRSVSQLSPPNTANATAQREHGKDALVRVVPDGLSPGSSMRVELLLPLKPSANPTKLYDWVRLAPLRP